MRLSIGYALLALALTGFAAGTASAQAASEGRPDMHEAEHPFLICTRSEFPALRARAAREPWKSMRADALAAVAAGLDEPDARRLQEYLGACALAYIVEPDRRANHAERVRAAIETDLAALGFDPNRAWSGVVAPMGAAFVAILALDIVYDDLTAEQIERCEAVIERQIGRIPREGSWPAARYGTHGTWEIYTGVRTEPDDAFYENYRRQMTDDGVTTVSPGYAFARLGSDRKRPQKTGYADVLEFTGIDRRYYDDERLKKFYRWLFSASVDPARQWHMFGDVGPSWGPPNSALLWRVGRFDRQAAAYAAWLLRDREPPGHVLSYVLMTEPLPDPVVPRSRLFEDGGAVFRERPDRPESLGAALYNITGRAEWHTHEETNAIAASAYGARLLVNGGWLGDSTRPPDRNNTLAIDGERHEQRTGAGLSEGLLAEGFDYACGDSGAALGDDAFARSLILVHSRGDVGGYFIVIDEVDAAAGETVHHYLQARTETEPTEVAARREYRARIDHHARIDGVELSVFYASEPETVRLDLVPSGDLQRTPAFGRHYRLEATYPTGAAGDRRMVTILFPHDATHPKAEMTRVSGDGYSGGIVRSDAGASDLILTSSGEPRLKVREVAFEAKAVVCRRHEEPGERFYFARQGRSLRVGDRGFESSRPISIFMRQGSGQVTAREAGELTLHHPDAVGVRIDGESAEVMDAEPGRLRFKLPAGRHRLTVETR